MYGKKETNLGQGELRESPGPLAVLPNRTFYVEVFYSCARQYSSH